MPGAIDNEPGAMPPALRVEDVLVLTEEERAPLPGADLLIRLRRVCAWCGRTRLVTECRVGPLCNDCMCGVAR